jgi:hypothetical protein
MGKRRSIVRTRGVSCEVDREFLDLLEAVARIEGVTIASIVRAGVDVELKRRISFFSKDDAQLVSKWSARVSAGAKS